MYRSEDSDVSYGLVSVRNYVPEVVQILFVVVYWAMATHYDGACVSLAAVRGILKVHVHRPNNPSTPPFLLLSPCLDPVMGQ